MSRTTTLFTVAAAATLSLAACKKKDEAEGGAGKASEKAGGAAAKAAPKDTGPFAGWDMAAREAAWQGAHVGPGGSIGRWEAWEIKGDKATVWDGQAEKTLEVTYLSPCEIKLTERGSDGSSSSTTHHYTIRDGQIVQGLGDAGSRKGKEAIACVSNTVVTMDAAGTCTEWKRSMFDDGKLEAQPGTCRWIEEGGKEWFGVTVRDYEYKLLVDGDALLSEQLAGTHSEKVADFAAARAARDAR